MTLFVVGVAHLIIGVELTNAQIAIPWFPTINFEHPERLIYLYWALVVYSIYRYSLHHGNEFRKLRFESLHRSLSKPRGRTFISTNILSEELKYSIDTEKVGEEHVISLRAFIWERGSRPHDSYQVNIFYFKFHFSSSYRFIKIETSENEDYELEKVCFKNDDEKAKWGLQAFSDGEQGELTVYRSFGLPWSGHKVPLFLLIFPNYCKAIGSQKHIFDLLLPMILNALLAVAWLVCG